MDMGGVEGESGKRKDVVIDNSSSIDFCKLDRDLQERREMLSNRRNALRGVPVYLTAQSGRVSDTYKPYFRKKAGRVEESFAAMDLLEKGNDSMEEEANLPTSANVVSFKDDMNPNRQTFLK